MKRILLIVVALAFVSWSPVYADVMFSFIFNGDTVKIYGTLTAVLNPDGTTYTAISGSGYEGSDAITLFLNPNGINLAYSPSGAFIYDNQLFPGSDPLISNGGLLFSVDGINNPLKEVNIWSNGPSARYSGYDWLNGYIVQDSGTFTLTRVVPEPTSLLLLGLGLLGVAGIKRKMK